MSDILPMRVILLDGECVIGHADLTASDPSMCVASGSLKPTAHYKSAEHANIFDGKYVGDLGIKLRVLSDTHGVIESHGVSIQDSPALDEVVVDIIGIIKPSYDDLFRDDPNFRAWREQGDA